MYFKLISRGLVAGLLLATPLSADGSDPIDEAIKSIVPEGKVILNARLRYETVEQDGFSSDADAFTFRIRAGYQTPVWEGFQGLAEVEHISTLNDESDYNAAARYPSGRSRPIIADPDATELNRLWISYTADEGSAKVGRQLVTFDNHRFVGHVGWRQNIQTMDAAALKLTAIDKLVFNYTYVDKVHRIFGDDWPDGAGPDGNFNSSSHLINANYAGLPSGKLSVFAYLLDLENAAANSSSSIGLRWAGKYKPEDCEYTFAYDLSYAHQSDYADNTTSYDADYFAADFKVSRSGYTLGAGYELLGSDGGVKGFATPLATLHKFNGFADVFLATPAAGLQDYYLFAGTKLPVGKGLALKAWYHWFESDSGSTDYGNELDIVAAYPVTKRLKAVAKYADFDKGDSSSAYGSREKFSIQLDFAY